MAAPVKKFNSSGGLQVNVWKNVATANGKPVEFYTVSMARGYKDKDGEWASTTNLREQDIPKLRSLLQKAYNFIIMKNTEFAE